MAQVTQRPAPPHFSGMLAFFPLIPHAYAMIVLILKGLAAGAVVVTISEIATRFPRLAALILFVPIAVPLVFVLMYMKQPAVGPISSLARQSLLLIPLSLPLFIPMALADRWGWSFWYALLVGLLLLAATIGGYLWLSAR